jgi:3-oxoacyl-[acyl-carrier protein] reductase
LDLGLSGKTALICASSRGLGRACARALALEGCHVVINGRSAESLEATAQAIFAETGVMPQTVIADLATPEGRKAVLTIADAPDILVNNNGGPPPGALGEWTHADWLSALEGNLLAAIHLIEGVLPGMRERGFGRIVNITSAMVKTPKLPMALSTTARAGLTAFSRALAPEVIRDGVTINNLLPEMVETDRLTQLAADSARRTGLSPEDIRARMMKRIPAGRFGDKDEFAAMCAFMCSAQAGYITGQNIQIDGGCYPGLI